MDSNAHVQINLQNKHYDKNQRVAVNNKFHNVKGTQMCTSTFFCTDSAGKRQPKETKKVFRKVR